MSSFSASIQQAVQDFRLGCSEWEGEVGLLLGDVERFLEAEQRQDTADDACGGRATMVAAHVAEDVAGLRGLVEQQTEVLAALVNALTGSPTTVASTRECEVRTDAADSTEIDPFERLQRVVAAASAAD